MEGPQRVGAQSTEAKDTYEWLKGISSQYNISDWQKKKYYAKFLDKENTRKSCVINTPRNHGKSAMFRYMYGGGSAAGSEVKQAVNYSVQSDHQLDAIKYAAKFVEEPSCASNADTKPCASDINTGTYASEEFDYKSLKDKIFKNIEDKFTEELNSNTGVTTARTSCNRVYSDEPFKAPQFRKYSQKWPLGPTGQFFNSVGKMYNIKDMKDFYIKSTMKWIEKNFSDTSENKKIINKYVELKAELNGRTTY